MSTQAAAQEVERVADGTYAVAKSRSRYGGHPYFVLMAIIQSVGK